MAVMGGNFFAVFSFFFEKLIRQAPCEGPVEQLQGPDSTEGVMFYKVVLCFQKPKQLV